MSEKLLPESAPIDEGTPEYQRNKAPTKIPGTAVFKSPYSVSSKTGNTSPYYIMTSAGATIPSLCPNASDEDKRRIIHNETERKRKDKINKWIVRLCSLVPECNGKLSKNCILEKTVNFIEVLKQEKDLPDDVQALKAEVIKLTKNVESLSSENAHYLNLLKEAQNLSKGAWSLNMSIHKNRNDKSQSSSSDGEDTTMTPTLDRASVSNMTKPSSTPNLPTIVTAPKRPKKQKLITVPMMTANNTTVPMLATNNASAVPAQPLLAGQPIQLKLQPQAGVQQGPTGHGLNTVATAYSTTNGQPILTTAHQVFTNVQVKDAGVLKSSGHSIQALLGADNIVSTANNNKTIYTIPTYLQATIPAENGGRGVYMAGHTPIVAAPPIVAAQPQQTPVLVQGENGPVVMMIHGSIPHFAVPLNTMSSNPVMCEPTFHFKSPLVLNQFPSLINPESAAQNGNQTTQNPIQIGSLIQGPQGQQQVVVGTQPVMSAQLPPQSGATITNGMQTSGQTGAQTVTVGVPGGGQTTATVVGVPQGGMVGVHQANTTPAVLQVVNSEGTVINSTAVAVTGAPTQCFIPMVDQTTVIPVTMTSVTSVSPVVTAHNTAQAPQPPPKNTNVTDFSISQICQPYPVGEGEEEVDVSSGDIYLTSTSEDTSFGSDCFTPPYSSSNEILSSVNYRDTMSPDPDQGDNKQPLNHSIASLTGINN